ncbi:uncharacterized protein EI90DRAFT_2999943 [Cantharellus anzutake]|uniref:uncharacterized protein n=1 Tax=Cantharellus anzutake TaxID=1750568 RepID=UPI00190667DE|nr:uncharacterized protein EI90DRAFT_2999943 [Cantharellus anzutake]KAF8325464.1 hypothetical protein EI90DRAFT_2999943 [Cantharellus anzutake]
MATSASRTYEQQNDEQLDALHSKLRTLRGITIDIHDDAERQNRELDGTRDYLSSFASGLSQSGRNATRAFGGAGGISQLRMIVLVVSFFIGFWITWKAVRWFFPSTSS